MQCPDGKVKEMLSHSAPISKASMLRDSCPRGPCKLEATKFQILMQWRLKASQDPKNPFPVSLLSAYYEDNVGSESTMPTRLDTGLHTLCGHTMCGSSGLSCSS